MRAVIAGSAVAKRVDNAFAEPDLPVVDADHRRVLAVLRFLGRRRRQATPRMRTTRRPPARMTRAAVAYRPV